MPHNTDDDEQVSQHGHDDDQQQHRHPQLEEYAGVVEVLAVSAAAAPRARRVRNQRSVYWIHMARSENHNRLIF